MKTDLENDIALSIIERVEEPSEWCQRMVCVRRPDAQDGQSTFNPFIKFCKREE